VTRQKAYWSKALARLKALLDEERRLLRPECCSISSSPFASRDSGQRQGIPDAPRSARPGVVYGSVDDFYSLARICLVKDEAYFDRFDLAFAAYFKGVHAVPDALIKDIPVEWLQKLAERWLTDEEKARIEALGGWQKIMEALRERLEEQKERHQGGSKWIGTAGTSPFGAHGYNPEGVRIGQGASVNRRAVKVWDRREYPRLRQQSRAGRAQHQARAEEAAPFRARGRPDILDLDGTIRSTAKNAGWLDLKMVPEVHNAVKVLLFLDVGGTMDDHIHVVEELFSATRTEFKNLEYFYFHNCVYESVWKDNRRRHVRIPTVEVLRKYGRDYKLILVGDASMSPYELDQPGGASSTGTTSRGAPGSSGCCAPGRTRRGSIPFPRSTGPGPRRCRTSCASWTGACTRSPWLGWSAR
jgi:uncharacterized protein with von Willebrand factor type A (vWA) domain